MQTILVTGGTGYIGSHICNLLLEKDFNVVIVDSLINSKEIVVNKLEYLFKINNKTPYNLDFIEGDIRDINLLESIFEKYMIIDSSINAVIHCAGMKAVAESVKNPILYWDVNLIGSINLLKTMEKYSCFNLVFSSSATIYGHPNESFSFRGLS